MGITCAGQNDLDYTTFQTEKKFQVYAGEGGIAMSEEIELS